MSKRKVRKFGDPVSGPYGIKAVFLADGREWRYSGPASSFTAFTAYLTSYAIWVMLTDLGDSLSRTLEIGQVIEVWW